MGAIGWIWACLMLLGGVRAHLAQSLPHELVGAMILSGVLSLPPLWDRDNGPLAAFAPTGLVRAGLAALVLVIAGFAHPSAVMGIAQI